MTSSIRALTAALAFAATVSAGANATLAEPQQTSMAVRPLQGLSLDVGSKHAVGYYQAIEGACNLTLLVADATGEHAASQRGTVPVRFSSTIPAGRTARIDTGEGPSLEFVCATGAKSLNSRVIERLAYMPAAK